MVRKNGTAGKRYRPLPGAQGIWQATLTEQSASYSVVVYMAPSGSADSDFKPFAWYKVEKKSGKMVASLDRYEYPIRRL